MPIPLEALLAPISAEKSCGDDISYDPAFQELDTLILGKLETQFSPAEPPDWAQVRERSLELFARSKHLRLALGLTAALIRLEGIRGFRDGIALLEGLVGNHWDPLYPRLDPDDENDPTERLNILASLSSPVGLFGDPYKIVEALRSAPLSASAQMGRFSLQDVTRSQAAAGDAAKGPPFAQVDASFRDTRPEVLEAVHGSVAETLALLKSLTSALANAVGEHRVPPFDLLVGTLREIQKLLAPHLPAKETVNTEPAPDASLGLEGLIGEAAPASSPVAIRSGFSGGIDSREEVVRALELICNYYSRREPSSPVPLLLERAKRLVQMDFMAIVQEIAPEAVGQINAMAGIR